MKRAKNERLYSSVEMFRLPSSGARIGERSNISFITMKRMFAFLFLLLTLPSVSFASVLLDSAPHSASYLYNQNPLTKSNGDPMDTAINCGLVNGNVESITSYISGWGSAPAVTGMKLVFKNATSSNSATTSAYPNATFTWTFSPAIECISGTSTLKIVADNPSRGFIEWASVTGEGQYFSYDPTHALVLKFEGTAYSEPEATSSPVVVVQYASSSEAEMMSATFQAVFYVICTIFMTMYFVLIFIMQPRSPYGF